MVDAIGKFILDRWTYFTKKVKIVLLTILTIVAYSNNESGLKFLKIFSHDSTVLNILSSVAPWVLVILW